MVRTHCNQKLIYEGTSQDMATKIRKHVWRCGVCGKLFYQRPRVPKNP